jgi:hypothetical protein
VRLSRAPTPPSGNPCGTGCLPICNRPIAHESQCIDLEHSFATVSAAPKAPVARTVPAKAAPAAERTKPAPAGAAAPFQGAKNGSAKAVVGIGLEDILAVKELVGRVGSSQLKTLIDAFAG